MLRSVKSEMFREQYATVFDGDARWRSLPMPDRRSASSGSDDSTYIRNPPFFDGLTLEPVPPADIVSARASGAARRQRHDGSHLAGRVDSGGQPGWPIPDREGRRAGRLQLVRRAARQPRSDDARNVRQHPPAQPARARNGGRMDVAAPRGRADDDLRRLGPVSRSRRAAHRHRGQGVRVRIVARLGRQGHAAARRQGGDCRELRAHSPQQPGEHGRAAAASSGPARPRRR